MVESPAGIARAVAQIPISASKLSEISPEMELRYDGVLGCSYVTSAETYSGARANDDGIAFQNPLFQMQNSSFLIQHSSCLMQHSSFLARISDVRSCLDLEAFAARDAGGGCRRNHIRGDVVARALQNPSFFNKQFLVFLMQNSSFVIHNSSFFLTSTLSVRASPIIAAFAAEYPAWRFWPYIPADDEVSTMRP